MLTQHIQKIALQEVETNTLPTWKQLCQASPELVFIKIDAGRELTGPQDRTFWQRYESLKRRMASCVGMYAHPGLPEFVHTSQAYDLAHKEIFGRYV